MGPVNGFGENCLISLGAGKWVTRQASVSFLLNQQACHYCQASKYVITAKPASVSFNGRWANGSCQWARPRGAHGICQQVLHKWVLLMDPVSGLLGGRVACVGLRWRKILPVLCDLMWVGISFQEADVLLQLWVWSCVFLYVTCVYVAKPLGFFVSAGKLAFYVLSMVSSTN